MSEGARVLEPRLEGLVFPECPRWYGGRLWFSDMHAGAVQMLDGDGQVQTVVEVPGGPGGLGFLPDARMLVVSMADRKVLRLDPGGLVVHADLAGFAEGKANDMVVDAFGRAYVGNYGFDLDGGGDEKATNVLLVEPSGTVHVVAEGLRFPNGMALLADGQTLVVAESYGQRLLAFDVEPDGWLSGGRVFADLKPNVPDGICADEAGAIWVADPVYRQVFRVLDGGEITHAYEAGDLGAFACVLGGALRRILYVCLALTSDPAKTVQQRAGRVSAIPVDVSGAGIP
jgi:sugar lactone lactonase YvrE